MPLVRLSPPAHDNLKRIGRDTEKKWGREQRLLYLAALKRRMHRLAASPHEGSKRDDIKPGMRHFKEGKHIIFYKVIDGGIFVFDILHERMDIPARMESWTQH